MVDYLQNVLFFFNNVFKIVLNAGIEKDPSAKSNSSFHFGADIVNILFLYAN